MKWPEKKLNFIPFRDMMACGQYNAPHCNQLKQQKKKLKKHIVVVQFQKNSH
jgi:hypothetical protein